MTEWVSLLSTVPASHRAPASPLSGFAIPMELSVYVPGKETEDVLSLWATASTWELLKKCLALVWFCPNCCGAFRSDSEHGRPFFLSPCLCVCLYLSMFIWIYVPIYVPTYLSMHTHIWIIELEKNPRSPEAKGTYIFRDVFSYQKRKDFIRRGYVVGK